MNAVKLLKGRQVRQNRNRTMPMPISGYQAPPVVYPSTQGVSEVEEAKARQSSPSREVVGN